MSILIDLWNDIGGSFPNDSMVSRNYGFIMNKILYSFILTDRFKAILCIFASVSFSPCIHATLVSRDWLIPGDAALTYDSATGMEWLDLTQTSDMSYNDVAIQLNAGGFFESFTFASETQVLTLFKAVNLPEIELGQSDDGPKIEMLLNLWGVLWQLGANGGRSEFIISDIDGIPLGQHWVGRVVWTESGDTGADAKIGVRDEEEKNFTIGSALIRPALNVQIDGDVNRDGVTNLGDLLVIIQVVLGRAVASGIEPGHADFYPQGAPDGIIDISDLILMRGIIL